MPLSFGVDGHVHDFQAWDDGGGESLYIAGGFESAGGWPERQVVRWNDQGFQTLDGGLGGPAAHQTARTIAVLPGGGGLFIGGSLNDVQSSATANMAWWLEDCGVVP
jgi:hypothetical protein